MRPLPEETELARRAAGGDGAAFVQVYDRHVARVFELALAATGSVDEAADATQVAFLTLLRRPPALAAPDREVSERLLGFVLHACGAEEWLDDRRPAVHAGRFRKARIGWLRRETVAKAAARFDADWTRHLADGAPEPTPIRTLRLRRLRPAGHAVRAAGD